MSRVRIVKGKYIKITGGEHRMFSEGKIISSAGEKYQEKGEEGGIVFKDPEMYEPWKSFPRYDWYHCVFGHTTNKKISVTDLGINMEVEMCLTGITSVIRFEAYDLSSKNEFKFHNWVYILNVFMNNRGELVEGGMDLVTYKANRQVGSTERGIEKDKSTDKAIFKRTQYPLKSKGKDLHDEVFLDKKLIFSNRMERSINFDSKNNESSIFYDLFGDFLKEASRFNRRSVISYIFAGTESAESFLSAINETAANIAFVTDSKFLEGAFDKFKGVSLFKEIFGTISYFTGTTDNVQVLAERIQNIRGPIQLTETQCARNNGDDKMTDPKHYLVTNEFELLGEALQQTKKKLKKDE